MSWAVAVSGVFLVCVMGVVACSSVVDRLWQREEVSAAMSCCVGASVRGVVGVKPARQSMAGAKSSVSGMFMEAHGAGVVGGCVLLRLSMSNSLDCSVVSCVVESRYLGEATAMSLWGGVDEGARPFISQADGVGTFWMYGMSISRQFRRCPGNCIRVFCESSCLTTPVAPTCRRAGRPGSSAVVRVTI